MKIERQIEALEQQIRELPQGTITMKRINGKEQPYLQWRENGKIKSKYVKKAEYEDIFSKIQLRQELQNKLNELRQEANFGSQKEETKRVEFETNVVIGTGLLAMTKGVKDWKKRDCFSKLQWYLYNENTDRVCLVYGLRRTGKTTLLRQAVLDMKPEDAQKAAYIKIRNTDTIESLNRDLKKLQDADFHYVFIDEVTLMDEFIDNAALFSDVYAAQGMKIVLSGTDSLGFWFTLHQELYDRAVTIHTTFIPFWEHSRLLGIDSIDEYIRYGGTLRAGELNFDDSEVNAEEASFRDDESTRRYIDTAICRNIQHSLASCKDGGYFRHLETLYEAGELTGAINRVIEDMNHRFLVRVLTDAFKSHDLGSTADILRRERNTEKRTDILEKIDKEAVTERLMNILDIRNREQQSIGITDVHVAELKEYLKALDLIIDCPKEVAISDGAPLESVLFTQPGMRYCQAQALVYVLAQGNIFAELSEWEKTMVTERILEEVRGRMMEEIVLLETIKAAGKNKRVFKLIFAAGEFDMVIYDSKENTCECYEVKHSTQIVDKQMRVLLDEESLMQTEKKYGTITRRCVLYRGETTTLENGIEYLNVENYLKSL